MEMHNIQGAMAETNSSRTEQVPTPKTVEKNKQDRNSFFDFNFNFNVHYLSYLILQLFIKIDAIIPYFGNNCK